VRAGLERPDTIASAAVNARLEVGRAIADKIREIEGDDDLKHVVEDVLPKIEKFLESPEEKRLRRMRAGIITSAVGVGAILMFFLIALFTRQEEVLVAMGAGVVAFIIGVGILINGKSLSVPNKQEATERAPETASQNVLDRLTAGARNGQKELRASANQPLSVVEHTTHKLSNEAANVRRQPTGINQE